MALMKSTVTPHETKYLEFIKIIDKICSLLKTKIGNKVDLEAVALRGEALPDYFSKEFKAKPEAFTKENIIEELLDLLGFDKSRQGRCALMFSKKFNRKSDYKGHGSGWNSLMHTLLHGL